MNRDIDTVSADLTQELTFASLEKTLPPKLLYRFRAWMKKFRPSPDEVKEVQKAMNFIESVKSLKKNESLASFYDDGHIRLDFGSDVSPKVKEAAMKWAKKRGLKASEASLDKSASAPSYVIMSTGQPISINTPLKSIKFSN